MKLYGNFFKGIGLSRRVQSGFDDLTNCDVWSELGALKCQKALTKKSGSVITAGCYRAVAPDGTTYFFSKTDGMIWKRSVAGVYSYVRVNAVGSSSSSLSSSPSATRSASSSISISSSPSTSVSSSLSVSASVSTSGSTSISSSISASISPSPSSGGDTGGHKGANYYNGCIFYTTDTYLGRYTIATDSWNDFFQLLTPGVPHAIEQFDLMMYITNSKDIAQLDDAGVFSSSGLDLPTEHRTTALIPYGDDLLTLSNPGDYINDSAIYRWNTYADSWTVKDAIKGTDAYAFLDADNNVFVICLSGAIYYYNGSKLDIFSYIRNPYPTEGHQLTTNFQGVPLVANGGKIYSLYRKTRDLDVALVGEYTCSAGESATIESIVACGEQLLVNWTNNGDAGVDEIDTNYFANARVITPRFERGSVVKVDYEDLNGAEIGIYSRKDKESNWTSHETLDDTDKHYVRTVDDMIHESGGQVLVTITPSGTESPIINDIKIE